MNNLFKPNDAFIDSVINELKVRIENQQNIIKQLEESNEKQLDRLHDLTQYMTENGGGRNRKLYIV